MSISAKAIPTRSEAGRFGSAVFHRNKNDFDIYVEDTALGYRKIFAILLRRALRDPSVKLERVYPLGGREKVLEAARTAYASDSNKKAVFIVDGDLFLLAGDNEDLPKNAIVLPRYCVENFLVDFNSLVALMNECDPEKESGSLVKLSDFPGWLANAEPGLRKLFVTFAIAKRLGSGIKTVSLGHGSVCGDKGGNVNFDKINKISEKMIDDLEGEYGPVKVNEARRFVESRVKDDLCFARTYVSGKDFLLPLLFLRAKGVTKIRDDNLALKLRIAHTCSVEPLAGVAKEVRRIAG